MTSADPQKVFKDVSARTDSEFNSLGHAIDKSISSVTELVLTSINRKQAPSRDELKKAVFQKVHITKIRNVLMFKCTLLALLAFVSNPLCPVFGLIVYPGTVLALHFYSETILQKNAAGIKRQRMPQESAVCGAIVGVLGCILGRKNLLTGVLYGALVGLLSCCYRVLDYVYRQRK